MKLTVVQTQLFHVHQQGTKESVDEFSQGLRKLFARVYAGISQSGPEAEQIAQTVLANQFIIGLRPELKSKVVGTEGNLDQLLAKAKFEEAKRRDLAELSGPLNLRRSGGGAGGGSNKPSPSDRQWQPIRLHRQAV